MRRVQRSDIQDYQTYNDQRDEVRRQVMAIKRPRRIHGGEYLTFLFENFDTVRYQVQEMMRTERIVRESDVQREIDTYNEILGDVGELGCVLLIEIDDRDERNEKLRAWRGLPEHLYLELADGTRVRPSFDERQVGDEKLSSVQYLKFEVGEREPVAVGSNLPALTFRSPLSDEQRAALLADLS